ncbi:MAG: hypothetical protein HY698_05500 [Deltaproteobacteria bacterium]|nr:hypothetical protein [Deltaproteobacteria bacterium]
MAESVIRIGTSNTWSPPRDRVWWTREDGRAMVAAVREAGGSLGAFARKHGPREERVRRWVRRVERRQATALTPAARSTLTFVPVRLVEQAGPEPAPRLRREPGWPAPAAAIAPVK